MDILEFDLTQSPKAETFTQVSRERVQKDVPLNQKSCKYILSLSVVSSVTASPVHGAESAGVLPLKGHLSGLVPNSVVTDRYSVLEQNHESLKPLCSQIHYSLLTMKFRVLCT